MSDVIAVYAIRQSITIAKNEIRLLSRTLRLPIVFVLFLILIVAASWFAAVSLNQYESERISTQEAERVRWLEQGQKHPHAAAHFGFYAFRPLHPLAWIETGVMPFTGTTVWLEAHRQNEVTFRPIDDTTSMQRFGVLNLSTIIITIAPLLLIVLFYDSISGERDRQTLALLLCQGIRPLSLYCGKLVAAGLLIVVLLCISAVAVFALMYFADKIAFSTDLLLRFFVVLLVFSGYLFFWVNLSLCLSAYCKSSQLCLGVLIVTWMLLCVLAPRFLADFAARHEPLPSRLAFDIALQSDLNNRTELNERLLSKEKMLLARFNSATVDELPVNFRALQLQYSEEHANFVYEKHYSNLFDLIDRQNYWLSRFSFLAPGIGTRILVMRFVGTDFRHYRHFIEEAEQYRRLIQTTLNNDLYLNPETAEAPYLADRTLWEKVPKIKIQPIKHEQLWDATMPVFAALVLWQILLPIFGWKSTIRFFRAI
jgi:ABC-2 type transport system permease protein